MQRGVMNSYIFLQFFDVFRAVFYGISVCWMCRISLTLSAESNNKKQRNGREFSI